MKLIISILVFLTATAVLAKSDKVTICHATESEVNPFVRIVVSENAIGGHFDNPGTPKAGHEDDLLFDGEVNCPGDPVETPSDTPSDNPSDTPEISVEPSVGPSINPSVEPSVEPSTEPTNPPTPQSTTQNNGGGTYTIIPIYTPDNTPVSTPVIVAGVSCSVITDFVVDPGITGDGKVHLLWSGDFGDVNVDYGINQYNLDQHTTGNGGLIELSGLQAKNYWFQVSNDCSVSPLIDPLP